MGTTTPPRFCRDAELRVRNWRIVMKHFTYLIIDDRKQGSPDSEIELNDLGLLGWELVTVMLLPDGSRRWYFKRENQE